MHSIIQELYYGNLNVSGWPLSEESRQLFDRFAQNREEFARTLTDAQKKMFDQLMDQLGEAHYCEVQEKFSAGFCVGARMMSEVMQFPQF